MSFGATVRLASVTLWNSADSVYPQPLLLLPSQLDGLDLRTTDGAQSVGCAPAGPAPTVGAGGAWYSLPLQCDPGSGLSLDAPNLARSTAQQLGAITVQICTAASVVGPRDVSVLLQQA